MISYNKSKIILKKSIIKLEEEIIDTNKCLNRVTSKNIYVKSYYLLLQGINPSKKKLRNFKQ